MNIPNRAETSPLAEGAWPIANILDLENLCDWLNLQPAKTASYKEIKTNQLQLAYILLPPWAEFRKESKCLAFQAGKGWHLKQGWQENIARMKALNAIEKPELSFPF